MRAWRAFGPPGTLNASAAAADGGAVLFRVLHHGPRTPRVLGGARALAFAVFVLVLAPALVLVPPETRAYPAGAGPPPFPCLTRCSGEPPRLPNQLQVAQEGVVAQTWQRQQAG